MVEWLQIYIPTSFLFSPVISTITHLVMNLVNNQVLLWSSVVVFIIILRWITHPRRHVW